MCHRVYFSHQGLSYKGKATGVLYGFFRQLIALHKKYPEHFRIIAWDGGHERRTQESRVAVEAGVIPSEYKDNRKDRDPAELEAIFEQMDQLREVLKLTRCLQVRVKGIEADDVINTYADYAARWKGEAVVVSSDKDFYQTLGPSTSIYDAMKDEVWTEERFKTEMGFVPPLWVDAGSIMGDSGDNIRGCEGWGPVTTFKYVREFGGLDAVLAGVAAKPKRNKKEDTLLASEPVLRLARSLKQMDIVPGLPRPRVCRPIDKKVLDQFFVEHGFVSLMRDSWRMV
jgi:DNA polymerase-1